MLSFFGVELGYVSVLSQKKQIVVQDFEEKFSFYLDCACFMPTSKFLYCMNRVLRRKSFSISNTIGHNTLYHVCMKTAVTVVL